MWTNPTQVKNILTFKLFKFLTFVLLKLMFVCIQKSTEEEEKATLNEDRKVNLVEVLVTEVTDDAKFYGCTVSDGPALEKLMDNIREEFSTNPPLAGAYQPKKHDLCAAKFVDDQWYRAKVEKVGPSDAQVWNKVIYFLGIHKISQIMILI